MKTYIEAAAFLLRPHVRWVVMYIVIGAFFILVTNVGYINYVLHETDEYQYTGANAYAAADKLVYLSMIEQGREGAFFMKNLHTTDPQKGVLFSPHWYVIGQTARLFSISNLASYQLYRVLFTVGFLAVLFFIVSRLTEQYLDRLGMTLFVLFSGGLGWLYIMFRPEGLHFANVAKKFLLLPTDIYVTEGNTLLNFAQAPLFALSQFMILLLFYIFVAFRDRRSTARTVSLFFITLSLSLMHPYDIPFVLAILGTWSVWNIVRTRSLSIVGALASVVTGCVLGVAYNLYVVASDPVIASWLAQNLVYSPAIHLYAWGYGLLLPFAFFGLVLVARRKFDNPWWVLMGVWVVLMPILLYFPTNLNRRFINGFHLALAFVAYEGCRYIFTVARFAWARAILGLFFGIGLVTSMIAYLFINFYFHESIYAQGLYYTSKGDRAAVEFLSGHTPANSNLLVYDKDTNFIITSAISRAVFRGHDHQVPRFELKDQQLVWFAADQGLARARERKYEFLRENNIDYLVINDVRVEPRITWIEGVAYLEKVYDANGYRVYRVAG